MKRIHSALALVLILFSSNSLFAQSIMSIRSEQEERLQLTSSLPIATPELPECPIFNRPTFDLTLIDPYREAISKVDGMTTYRKLETAQKANDSLRKVIDAKNTALAALIQKPYLSTYQENASKLKQLDSAFTANISSMTINARKPLSEGTAKQQYSIDSLYNDLIEKNKLLLKSTQLIHFEMAQLKTMIDSITKNKIAKIDDYLSEVNKQQERINKQLEQFGVTYSFYKELYSKTQKLIQTEVVPAKTKTTDFEAAPDITGLINDASVIPTITLLAHTNFTQQNTFGEVRIFTGATPTKKNDSIQQSRNNLLLPTASSFGIIGSFMYYQNKDSKYAFFSQFSFTRKILASPSGKTESIASLHLRLGFEYAIFPKFISLYANVAGFAPIANNAWYRSNTTATKDVVFYPDLGAKLYMNFSKNLSATVDLNFIGITSDVRKITGATDFTIPSIRIGLAREINSK